MSQARKEGTSSRHYTPVGEADSQGENMWGRKPPNTLPASSWGGSWGGESGDRGPASLSSGTGRKPRSLSGPASPHLYDVRVGR